MKIRLLLMLMGLAFSVTLAVIVGQRLSSEAMAVTVGVIAGVAASIPTSLLVVWFASRALHMSRPASAEMMRPEPSEPRIVVMTPPAYQSAASYAPAPAYPLQAPAAPRHFMVIGGMEIPLDQRADPAEARWQP